MGLQGVQLKDISDIHVGDTAYFAKTVTEADVMLFAQVSGDFAPHHVNREFGASTIFKSRIAHGMLTAGMICPVLTKLCGDNSTTYYQKIRFRSAVVLNDTMTVEGKVVEVLPEQKQVKIDVVGTRQNSQPGDRPLILATFIQALNVEVRQED